MTKQFSISDAAQLLRDGALLAIPTETVYGLAANAQDSAAVEKIFATKGRPADHPLIVHVQGAAQAEHFAQHIPPFATALMAAFWPGPLTLILPRHPQRADAAAGGQASIGLRAPAHPLTQQLLEQCAALGICGLAAPSANRFGKVSPTTASHVRDEFGQAVAVLDGGPCQVGIESTIIDCTRGAPILLRPGHITPEQINAALANANHSVRVIEKDSSAHTAPKASGTLESHYAPQATLRLMTGQMMQTALEILGQDAKDIATYSRVVLQSPSAHIIRRRMPDDATTTAQQLFAVLREFDAQGVKLIWVETPPEDPSWDGVRDRLQRAAA